MNNFIRGSRDAHGGRGPRLKTTGLVRRSNKIRA